MPERLAVGRGVVLFRGLVTILIAAYFARAGEKSVLGSLFELYAIFSGGIVGLFALAFFTRKAYRKGVIAGIIACILFTCLPPSVDRTVVRAHKIEGPPGS
jgi:SSS family solute:Na+ symporter